MKFLRDIFKISLDRELVDALKHGPTPRRVNTGKLWNAAPESVSLGKVANYSTHTIVTVPSSPPVVLFAQDLFAKAVLLSMIVSGATGRELFFGKEISLPDRFPPGENPGLIYGGEADDISRPFSDFPPMTLNRGQRILGVAGAVFTANFVWNLYVPSLEGTEN